MGTTRKVTAEQVQKWADDARDEWLAEHGDEETVKAKIRDMLDERLEDVVASLLGFRNSWGKWEVDNGNGRRGESAAGEFLRQKAGKAVNEWLAEQAKSLPALPASIRKSLLSAYNEELYNEARHQASKIATDRAAALVAKALGIPAEELTP